MAAQYFTITDPQFGNTIVRANGIGEARSFYQSYLKSIGATSTGNTPGTGVSQGVQRAIDGAHVIAGADRGDQGMIGFRLGTVSSGQPAGMWASNAELSDSDYFRQFGYTADGHRYGEQKGPGDVGRTGNPDTPVKITGNASYSGPDTPGPEETGFLESADNVAGFLKGLGYDIGAAGAGGASDFRYQQGYLGAGNYNAGEAADYFRNQAMGVPGDYRIPDADYQRFGADIGGFGNIGTTALNNLSTLGQLQKSQLPTEGPLSRFVTPLSAADNDAQWRSDISNLFNAAYQGAGVSSQFLGRGVGTGDVGRMYSQYAANDPGLNVGGAATQDDSFLKYMAQQYGLNNFFNK